MSDDEKHQDPSRSEPIESPKRLSEEWWATRPPHVQARRCTAQRSDRTRQCRRVAWAGQAKCGHHGAKAEHSKAAARRRLDEFQDRAVSRLIGFAESDNVPAYVSLDATKDILDRGGLKPPTQVNVGMSVPWEEVFSAIAGIAQITQAESRARRGVTGHDPGLPAQPALSGPDPAAPLDVEVLPNPPLAPM